MSQDDRGENGFVRYIRRFKTLLRRCCSARKSVASPSGLTTADSPSVTIRKSNISGNLPPVQDVPSPAAAEATGHQSTIHMSLDARGTEQYNRLNAMLSKYNVEFNEFTWPIRPAIRNARVEKSIRMRVRIICHYCRTNYSASKECTNCHHRRCEKCTRLPPKNRNKNKEGQPGTVPLQIPDRPSFLAATGTVLLQEASVDAAALSADEGGDEAEVPRSSAMAVSKRPKRRKEVPVVMSSRTGGQNLIRREPVQRDHRTCCKCQRPFVRNSNECPHCRHLRCTQCPQVPPKLDKWPNGYPGNILPAEPERIPRQWKKPRVRVRWTCHECRKLFMEGEYRCANCSHTRCTDCEREPPRRARQQFSEEAVAAVQGKLAAVGAPTTEPDVAEAPGCCFFEFQATT
ncbi:hypothetical protein GJ744_011313 [Endocarpon pusillum]|uniref:Uncharacterized protein n=1 Tax=Endocarpon pusillum TaxID=364733 RepID=A0A8H7ARP4_9EURO|nr:hypothetical protein GJ744_011313 [Endocarpon pusillum]